MCALNSKEKLKAEIAELVHLSLNKEITENKQKLIPEAEKLLNIIVTDSVQSINFISLLEDEYELEIDDDDINLEFFSNIEIIANVILNSEKLSL